MRDDPYASRFYGRPVDESFLTDLIAALPYDNPDNRTTTFPRPLPRVLLILMSVYLCCALFLIFAVSSYAAPLGSATISSHVAAPCTNSEATTVR
jgi:hypothetical protein